MGKKHTIFSIYIHWIGNWKSNVHRTNVTEQNMIVCVFVTCVASILGFYSERDQHFHPLVCLVLHCTFIMVWAVAMKFPKWFYCKRTCILTAYWEGSPSKYLPWVAMPLAQQCCHCWEHFWNSCCGIAFSAIAPPFFFLGCLQYPEIFVPLRQTLFLETVRSHLEPDQGNRVGFPFQ
jgi:hypothetical protein